VFNFKGVTVALITISGPSGAGKSTLLKGIRAEFKAKLLPSWTTRAPRTNSNADDFYIHISKKEYFKKLKKGDFLLSDEVSDNYYGTSFDDVIIAFASSKVWLADLTAKSVLELIGVDFTPTVCIVIVIGKETSLQRLQIRGDSSKDIIKRLDRYDDEVSNCEKLKEIYSKTVFIDGNSSCCKLKKEAMEVLWKALRLEKRVTH
jgi:guanylate kinase